MGLKLTIVAAAIAAVVSALAAQIDTGGGKQATAAVGEPRSSVAVTRTSYVSLLDDLDLRIDALQTRANDRPDDWLVRMHLGSQLLERAGLTHQLDDYDRVQQALDEAFAIAPEGSGPLLLAARFNVSIHRLDVAEHYLDKLDRRALRKGEERLAAQVLRAQIAFQRGRYEVALAGLGEAAAVMPAAATVELALYHAKTGERAQAEALLEEALASTSAKDPRRRAWTQLQLGLLAMDRGQALVALERLQAADAELPGWWLVQEHIAEAYERLGHHRQAIAIYEELVGADDLPQHMDALARCYQHAGDEPRAQAWITRAAARWELQLARLPEAAMGHGLQHHLQFGTPNRALELALANYAVRPGGDAQVALARAYLKAGKFAQALALVELALATPYRTAGLHHVAAQALATLGHGAAAQEQLALGAAIDPSYQGQEHSH
jgi:predicted Zn-dependent protease